MAGAGGQEASPPPTPITASSSSSSMIQAPRSTMEMWNDLTLSSLNQDIPPTTPRLSVQHPIPSSSSSHAKAIALQDLLAEPLGQTADPLIRIGPPALGLCLGSTDGGKADLRWKRQMKNRESAARSRARKQAHTKELEKEVEKLSSENRELRHKYEELMGQTRRAQLPAAKKRKLIQRSVSAQF